MDRESIRQAVLEIKDEIIAWRRHLHQHPELSFQEERTSQYVYETLQSFGNLEVTRPTKTSVMARLLGDRPGKVLAIRADMDALPITEQNAVEYASESPGVMHACGHDGHTAMLLGAAKLLSQMKSAIEGEVRFLFQHAEEQFPGGAEEMVQAGVLDGVDQIICIHLRSLLEVGKIGILYGKSHAAPDTFELTILGKGGHAAKPHQAIDSIAIGAQVVTNLQHIVSRVIDPMDQLVLSVTKFIGGTTHNVLPDSVEIAGTVRSYDPQLRENVPALMERIIRGVTEAHGANYAFSYQHGYRPVINDETVTRFVEETAVQQFGKDQVVHLMPGMGGEDFSAYLQKVPGCFIYLGAGNEKKGIVYPHHHPRFDMDEDALEVGVQLFVAVATKLVVRE